MKGNDMFEDLVAAEERRRYTALMSSEGRLRCDLGDGNVMNGLGTLASKVGDYAEVNTNGRKFDQGKPQYGLIPPTALKETVKVLTLGAEKYDKYNWQKVPDAQTRYFDALQRHLWDWKSGDQLDPETGINHLAHAACNILFLLERDIYTEEEWKKKVENEV